MTKHDYLVLAIAAFWIVTNSLGAFFTFRHLRRPQSPYLASRPQYFVQPDRHATWSALAFSLIDQPRLALTFTSLARKPSVQLIGLFVFFFSVIVAFNYLFHAFGVHF